LSTPRPTSRSALPIPGVGVGVDVGVGVGVGVGVAVAVAVGVGVGVGVKVAVAVGVGVGVGVGPRPLPLRLTLIVGSSGSSLETMSVADRLPIAEGIKVTSTYALSPGVIVVLDQDAMKSIGFVPPIEGLMVRSPVPVFEIAVVI
jgi:hypothetical protein